jgi:hypothetical protein
MRESPVWAQLRNGLPALHMRRLPGPEAEFDRDTKGSERRLLRFTLEQS